MMGSLDVQATHFFYSKTLSNLNVLPENYKKNQRIMFSQLTGKAS